MAALFRKLLLPVGVALLAAGCDDPTRTPPVASVEISAEAPFLDVGQTVALSAEARTASGEVVRGAAVQWSSSDTTVARVSAGGELRGVAAGTSTISAQAGQAADSLTVTVEVPVARLAVEPRTLTLAPGKSTRVLVRMADANGHPVMHSVRFTSSARGVAEVSDSGVVTAKSAGSSVVTVIVGERRVEVPATVEAPYALTSPGTLGGQGSVANAINQRGQVVGRAQVESGAWHAFLWEGGKMRDLGSLGFAFSEAVAVNDEGVVVGNAGDRQCVDCGPSGAGNKQPWRWEDGAVTPLAIDRTFGAPILTDVNNAGQVTGYTYGGYYRFATGEAFVWKDGETTWIGKHGAAAAQYAPKAPQRGVASAINDAGLLVGSMVFYAGEEHPVAWRGGAFMDAGPVYYGVARAVDVNRKGQVAGVAMGGLSPCAGLYLWEAGTTTCLADIGVGGAPRAIDNLGRIVGVAVRGDTRYAFLWRDGRLVDLNGLVAGDEWILVEATGINDRGQIVGYAVSRASGATGAFLLTPPQ